MSELFIDKENGICKYNDKEHKYWDSAGNYISVTTLVGKYEIPYDKMFWSGYKALEKLLSPEEFKTIKDNLRNTKKINLDYLLEVFDFTKNDFNREQQNILDEWQKVNQESCERGTKIHAELENKYLKNKNCTLNKYGLGGKFTVNTNKSLEESNQDLLNIDRGVFPEYLIYRNSKDGKFKLAGQIDLLIKDGDEITIVDYKTNRKLDFKSFYDSSLKKSTKMKYPLNNLDDCNFIHYTLQLSTYAWMIQQLNPKFVIKQLIIVHYDHKGNVSEYKLDYLKDEVIRMCTHYKKQILLEELKNSRKPIEF